jgi:hypothetical protein
MRLLRRAKGARAASPAGALVASATVAFLVVVLATGAGAGFAAGVGASSPGATAPASWWTPPQHLTWFWQLQGTVKNDKAVAAYDIDGFENEASEVAALHAQGKRVICYIDAGTAEKFRPDYGEFPAATLGRSNGWPGERWLDIRQLGAIEPIMAARFRMCREKGFDAVEPDNIEAFANKSGFEISPAQQLTYNEWIANEVHALRMAVLQKNDGEQSAQLQPYFDGALSEQCNQYKECGDFEPYLAAGKPVLNAEYRGKLAKFCPADDAAGIMGARFALSLNGKKFEAC